MFFYSRKIILPAIFMFFALLSCDSREEEKKTAEEDEPVIVRVREAVDANTLNPINSSGELSGYLSMKLFQSLLSIDYKSLEVVPLLAENKPLRQLLPSGKVKLSYKIREEAKWDNGKPITADDVAFSLKVIKNPYSSNIGAAAFYESIENIEYEKSSKSFDIIFSEDYILNEIASGDYAILPMHVYDTNAYLQNFTVEQLSDPNSAYSPDEILMLSNFDEEFNSTSFQRDAKFINGSGSYQLKEWLSGQRIHLVKKKNWWADYLDGENTLFENNADEIIHIIIPDNTSALLALKNRELDVMRAIPAKDYIKLKEDSNFLAYFNLYSPDQLSYHYLGLNHKNLLLKDREIREALRASLDAEKIIKLVSKGYASRIVSPLPLSSPQYNDTLKLHEYDLKKARGLLMRLNFKDLDKDGFLEKKIDGELVDLELDYVYHTDNDFRKYIAIILKEDAAKIGLKLNLIPLEWSSYLAKIRNGEFDIFYGARIMPPVPRDHKSAFHSESIGSGGNFIGFSNPEADALIDSIRVELNEGERRHLNWKFQELIMQEMPYIYLFSPQERIAISKKFENAYVSSMRPGYWVPAFTLKANR